MVDDVATGIAEGSERIRESEFEFAKGHGSRIERFAGDFSKGGAGHPNRFSN